MLDKVLIANRGEIALRILRACKELGIKTVAVHSKADRELMHVRLADEAVCIGPASSAQSYLNIPALISAAEVTDSTAIHPGYGFLSENANFAEQVERSGFTFIGPRAETIRLMGDKVSAIQSMKEAGVPTVPGSDGPLGDDDATNLATARRIGYPVIIKAAVVAVCAWCTRKAICFRRLRLPAPKRTPPLVMARSTWKNSLKSRATWKCKSWPMARVTRSICMTEIARCSVVIKKCLKKRQRQV